MTLSNHLEWNIIENNVGKRIYIYIYIFMTGHFAVQQKLPEHCKSTTI